MQVSLDINDLAQAIPYAQCIIKQSNNPNYISNAYYCLMQDAKDNDNTQLLSKYSHARTDALKLLRDNTNKSPRHSHGDPTSLAPHERLTDLAVVPREKPHTGAASREQPRDSPVIER